MRSWRASPRAAKNASFCSRVGAVERQHLFELVEDKQEGPTAPAFVVGRDRGELLGQVPIELVVVELRRSPVGPRGGAAQARGACSGGSDWRGREPADRVFTRMTTGSDAAVFADPLGDEEPFLIIRGSSSAWTSEVLPAPEGE